MNFSLNNCETEFFLLFRYASSSEEEDPRIVSAKKRNKSPRLTKPQSGIKSPKSASKPLSPAPKSLSPAPKSLSPAPKSPGPVVDIPLIETIKDGEGTNKRKRTESSDSSDSSELAKKIKSGVSIDMDSRNIEDFEKERDTNEPDNAKEIMMQKEIDEEETKIGNNKNTDYNGQLNETGDSMDVDLESSISLESCVRIYEEKEAANKEDSVASSKPVTPPQKNIESDLDRNLEDLINQVIFSNQYF